MEKKVEDGKRGGGKKKSKSKNMGRAHSENMHFLWGKADVSEGPQKHQDRMGSYDI